jgi:predicted transposase/invertase (TIGR01784 family)
MGNNIETETKNGHGEMIGEAKTFEEYKGAGVFADLLLDRTFKKAFNPDSQNKVCLIALLNSVLEGEIASPIVDVQSRNKEYSDGSNENRTSVFDLHCIDSAQRRFIIEVQILFQENIVNRSIYYASQTIIAQGQRGKKYNYELNPVVTVVFMEFNVFADDRYIRRAKLREINGSCISDTLNFAFVELPKFNKPLDELETTLDKALYALKNMKNMTQMPKQYVNTVFELLFSTAKLAKLSKEEQKMIDEAQKAKWDNYAIHKAAIDSGLQQGLEQGLEQGRDQRSREIAKKMLLKKKPIEEITEFTELSEADVLAIKASLGQS